MQAKIKVWGHSNIGNVRKINEDKFAIADVSRKKTFTNKFEGEISREGILFFVCDGSGGDGRGEVASSLALHVFQEEIFNHEVELGFGDRLIRAATIANDLIWEQAQNESNLKGMATTLTAAWVVPPLVYVIEVGDSRCYLVRDQNISQITRDQSVVQTLIDGGVITRQAASSHPYRNVVLQSLGAQAMLVPVVTTLELAKGDRLLICSDGLSKYVAEEQLLELVVGIDDLGKISEMLVETAMELESDDNITVIVAHCEGDAFLNSDDFAAQYFSEAVEESPFTDQLEDLTDLLQPAKQDEENSA